MPAVSVIMPVYNFEKYLRIAIKSVLSQTLKDFELILVDDGSKDSSSDICDDFAQKDSRVVVCHKKNGGICDARNKGMELAKGEYITFIDNDDEYDSRLLEDNYKLAKEYHADIVKYGHKRDFVNDDKVIRSDDISYGKFAVVTSDNLKILYPEIKEREVNNFVWNGLYRRQFIEKHHLKFNKIHKLGYEDYEFNMILYPDISVMVLNPKMYYHWIQRYGVSTSSKFGVEKLDSIIRIIQVEQKLLKKLEITGDFYNKRMTAGLSAYIGYLLHPNSTLSKKDMIILLKDFKSIFGIITPGEFSPKQQKLYVDLYNRNKYHLLLQSKKIINLLKRIFTNKSEI